MSRKEVNGLTSSLWQTKGRPLYSCPFFLFQGAFTFHGVCVCCGGQAFYSVWLPQVFLCLAPLPPPLECYGASLCPHTLHQLLLCLIAPWLSLHCSSSPHMFEVWRLFLDFPWGKVLVSIPAQLLCAYETVKQSLLSDFLFDFNPFQFLQTFKSDQYKSRRSIEADTETCKQKVSRVKVDRPPTPLEELCAPFG